MSTERRPKVVELMLRAVIVVIILLFLSCAINPVKGERKFMLASEDQELSLGKLPHITI